MSIPSGDSLTTNTQHVVEHTFERLNQNNQNTNFQDFIKIENTPIPSEPIIIQPPPDNKKVEAGIKTLLNDFAKESNMMNKVMEIAMSGRDFSHAQLVLLQSATFKISFKLTTMSKLTEESAKAIKTTMQQQI